MGTQLWISGYNLAGYMDGSSYITSSWHSARDSVASELELDIETEYQGLSMSIDKTTTLSLEELEAISYNGSEAAAILDNPSDELTDNDKSIFKAVVEYEEALKELKLLDTDTPWSTFASIYHYYLEPRDRRWYDIEEDLEGEELQEVLEYLNRES